LLLPAPGLSDRYDIGLLIEPRFIKLMRNIIIPEGGNICKEQGTETLNLVLRLFIQFSSRAYIEILGQLSCSPY
jgi:hypothetical protein